MSKKLVKAYFNELQEAALREQLLALYEKFPQVKEYYDFAVAPKEDKLILQAKEKISKEYFPLNGRRPKARRSKANAYIKKFRLLGMDPSLLADFMGFNLELMQTFVREKRVADAFYKSMSVSFTEWIAYCVQQGIWSEHKNRVLKSFEEARDYPFFEKFEAALDIVD
jgi:predicted nucleic acid-binding protein